MIDPVRIPLGVSDPDGRIGAIRWNENDVDLIDLDTGQRLRRLHGIGSSLMIDGPALLGWQSLPDPDRWRLFRVALPPVDTAVEWSAAFDLPPSAKSRADGDRDFAYKFGRDDSHYVLSWKLRPQYRGGAPPPAALQDALAIERSTGRLDFDGRTLALVRRGDDDAFLDDRVRASRGEDLARRARGFVYRQAGELHNAPWRTPAGDRFLRSLGQPGDRDQRLSIVRADTLEALADDIEARDLDRTVPELALDGRHLAVVGGEKGAAVWRIYDTADGASLARLPYREGFRSFRVFDRWLLCLEEQVSVPDDLMITVDKTLHAWDMASARLLWTYRTEPGTIPNRRFLSP